MDGLWLDIGKVGYAPAFDLQEALLAARMAGVMPPLVLLQECPLTFTIGRSGSRENILASPAELEQRGIEVIEVSRGGDVTYHGPGQIIASPLFYLGDLGINGNQYMHRMEDVLTGTLAEYGINGYSRADYPGVWVDGHKIGAVGIAVKHGYTFHGVSLNVSLDLDPFRLINPCGMPAMPVTSLEKLLGEGAPTMDAVKKTIRASLEAIFDVTLRDESPESVTARLNEADSIG